MDRKKFRLVFSGLFIIFLIGFVLSSGFTVTSVSTTNVISNDTDLTGVFWLVNTQLTGGGQAITGTITPEEMKSMNSYKLQPQKPFNITAEALTETATYEIINEGVPIYKYSLITTEGEIACPLGVCYVATDAPACPNGTNWSIPIGVSTWGKIRGRFCIIKTQVGTKGVYNNPTINFEAKLKISNSDTQYERTVCSGGTTGCNGSSVELGNIGVATWTGSLVTGDSAPNQDNFVAILNNSANAWHIARKSTYENYFPKPSDVDTQLNTYLTTNPFAKDSDLIRGNIEINTLITPTNSAADNLLNENTSFTSSTYSTDPNNTGKVVVKLNRKLTSPNILFRIRADWLGVVIPTGLPKIIGVTTNKFSSGEKGQVIVQIQNIGEVQGTFSAQLISCNPFVQLNTSQSSTKTFQKNEINNISLDISGGNLSSDLSQSCKVKVSEVNNPLIYTTYQINLQMEKAKICVPGKIVVLGNLIKECSGDGKKMQLKEKCTTTVISDGKGNYICSPAIEEITEGACITDADCKNSYYCHQNIHVCVQKSGCIELIKNGNSDDKLDLVFVGDGLSNDEMENIITKMIDYSNQYNGLMSVEPFISNKEKFNIWMVNGGTIEGTGHYGAPDRGRSLEIAAQCTSAEYQAIISNKNFRSHAYFSGDTYLSLSSRDSMFWGRLFLHEFGHSFGQLADEYVEPSLGNRPKSPNCASSISQAQSWWGSVPGTSYFEGCSYVENNYRPTFNSIMRSHYILKDDYGPVNEKHLRSLLNKYK